MSMRDEFEKAFKKTYMDDNLNDFDRALWAAAWIVNHVHDHLCDMDDWSNMQIREYLRHLADQMKGGADHATT